MYKSAAAQRKELDVFKASDGFHAEVYEVPVKGSSIRMYSIEPSELVGKTKVPVIFNTHGGGFYFPLGAEEIRNSGYFT